MFWDNSKSNELQKVEEELMTTRIREMETLTELKELRLKVMELETQVQVSTNQLRRQDEENKKLREELDSSLAREKEMANKAREQQHRLVSGNGHSVYGQGCAMHDVACAKRHPWSGNDTRIRKNLLTLNLDRKRWKMLQKNVLFEPSQ